MGAPRSIPLSVLDLSILNEGGTSADALAATTELARCADRLGYRRFWVAEHHNMPSVACTSPPVMIAHLAARTERIRVGSGGVMLPNHAPLVVAEQFAMLEALHPGRIDLGIGRAPGTDQLTAAALRRSPDALGAEDFPQHLLDLMGLLGDLRDVEFTGMPSRPALAERFRATPVAVSAPAIFLLGSSGYSARLAGLLGLPFGFAHHFDMGGTLQAAELYLDSFRPSGVLDEPWLLITANVLAADTAEEAEYHGASSRITALGRRTGRFTPLPSAAAAAVHPHLGEAMRLPTNRIVGEAADVASRLRDLAVRTHADEVMVTSVAFDLTARTRSLELLAAHWTTPSTDRTEPPA
jgi:luciferase family oxidoreductase group 1